MFGLSQWLSVIRGIWESTIELDWDINDVLKIYIMTL